jgi:hypothetical protein
MSENITPKLQPRFRFNRRAAAIRTLLAEGWRLAYFIFEDESQEPYRYDVRTARSAAGNLELLTSIGWQRGFIECIKAKRDGVETPLTAFFFDAPVSGFEPCPWMP